ncbi:MAG: glycoside hydrolase family 97 N-terminal domain-containing protein [Ignavibacteriales bacterium]|nr:glycoside hydrolase family 97 N-terminal domain-containing protein [Ignavibacteriales bacterium]
MIRGLSDELAIVSTQNSNFDETWQPVLGEEKEIRNNYNQFTVTLQNIDTKKEMSIVFRLFNEGLEFRYEFPQMENQQVFHNYGRENGV